MDQKTTDMVISIAKDWLAGGIAAGVSKTAVAPIGERSFLWNTSLGPRDCILLRIRRR